MDIQLFLLSAVIFMTVIFGAVGLLFILKGQRDRRVKDRLQDVIIAADDDDGIRSTIVRDMELSTVPIINELLKSARWARKLDTLLVQADIKMRLGTFLALMMVSGAATVILMTSIFHRPLWALPVGIAVAFIPLMWARQKRTKRVRQFETQFPDALDMLTNALRAGMALTGAIQVVSEESPDPVGREFAILFEENRLGLDMKEALKKFGERIDSAELRLFVIAVILQRETGGNLAEILEGTAAVIRDRFRILGDVRTLTAQAKMSGLVLTILPLAMAVLIVIVAPDYLKGLAADPLGRYMIIGAIFLQVTGYLIMRRIVNIKV